MVCAAIGFLASGDYARKETVSGFLVPTVGVSKIFPPRTGLVTAVDVVEGQLVEAGAPLLTVQVGQTDSQGSDVDAEVLQTLTRQRDALFEQAKLEQARTAEERARLRDEVIGLSRETTALQAQLEEQHLRSAVAEDQVAKVRELVAQGYISVVEFKRRQDNYLAQRQNEAALAQQIVEKQSAAAQQGHALDELSGQLAARLSVLRGEQAGLEGRLAETSGRRAYQLRAPVSGRISALQARVGLVADPTIPQLAIVPTGSVLEAELLVPARAAGFVAPGQTVRLAYQAFPYQRFGLYGGRVRNVSRTLLRPAEIVGPMAVRDPSYRVTVTLDRQSIQAFGREFPLGADMTVKADIVFDRRSLLDWVLDPVRSLRGRST
ncbi:MAG TPA: HlyD family efflux transporter periplasmic adaptor subunit [Acetobacteraceae bacterium]|nr:HlyD family efflux transporter periplasmic adaptor subunit [Acetobacteraceae bacterium]